ncbi:MAG: ASKHA domain-containing protein [Opitutaceae bacterium]
MPVADDSNASIASLPVHLHINHQVTEAKSGSTVFDCAERIGVKVPTSCRKQGKCRECIVEVTSGESLLSQRSPEEARLLEGFRLSCRCRIQAEEGEIHCHTMRRGSLRITQEAYELPVGHRDFRLEPAITRDGERVLLDGVEIDRRQGALHGLAIDIGTTTVVLRLFNLENGQLLASSSFENPQRFGGSDVMARIQFDTLDGSRSLQRTLCGYLGHAIEELPVDAQSIYEIVIAGNSTMRDLFFRLNVHSIGQSPYQSITEHEMAAGQRNSTVVESTAGRLGLPVHPKARVYGMPIISGHVGADTAACMLATDIANEDRLIAIMDIGTNTELILGNRHRIMAASCPAGPAFEGGQLSCGMPGLPGAIESVTWDAGAGAFRTTVIGGGPAEGLCGSGLVDLFSELIRIGRMNRLGRFEWEEELIMVDGDADPPVTLNESDANILAQAKGANVAGLQIIFQQYGVTTRDLDVFYLAGGFGRHLNLESSKRIGLIPNIPTGKIRQVGNASIEEPASPFSPRRNAGILNPWSGGLNTAASKPIRAFSMFSSRDASLRPLRAFPGRERTHD